MASSKDKSSTAEASRQVGELYSALGQDCSASQLCVNVVFCVEQPSTQPEFVDTALLGQVCQLTGGRLALFSGPLLQEQNAIRLCQQLQADVLRIAGNESVLKIRTGLGYRAETVIGAGRHSAISGETELCGISEDSTFTIFLRQDSPLKDEVGQDFISFFFAKQLF